MPLFKPNISAMKHKRDIQALLETLQIKDAVIHREAMQALVEIAKPALESLTAILVNERIAASVQTDVAEILGTIRDESCIDALMRAVEMSRAREVTTIEQTTSALDRVYRPGFYVNQIATSEGLFRNSLATAIGKLGGWDAVRALFKMMTEEKGAMATNIQAAIKLAMSQALQSADRATIRQMSELMPAGSVEARVMIADCLTQLGGDQAVAELLEIASDEREEFSVRAAAISGIGRTADRNLIPQLEGLQYSGNRAFVREVQGALESIRMRFPPPPIE
jgi:HEAT repeat protein